MGTDIHTCFQKRDGDKWVDIKSRYEEHRHYALFAWLADVRNGYGFAGILTHVPIKPIALPRGLPEDFEVTGYEDHPTTIDTIPDYRIEYMDDKDKAAPMRWMGDHSHSWLTFDEILLAQRPGKLDRVGVIELERYKRWDGRTAPETWSGGISGPNIHVLDRTATFNHKEPIPDGITHVQIRFSTEDGYQSFVDEIARLKAEHGEGRMVFGFDS